MTPEEISQERSKRLRSAFLDQEFGGAKALLDDNTFGGAVEDKEAFLTSSAVAGWAGVALNRHVNPASPEWQGIKDGIARGYFKNQAASNVSDNDMFGMIAADYQAQDKIANASRIAAARGESWLGKFREVETANAGSMLPGRMTNYLGLARAAHDEMAAKVAPYRNTIKTVTDMARNIDTAPDGMNWGAMASELIKVPKEDRPYVLEAISNQAAGSDFAAASSVQRLAKEFDRFLGSYLDSAASSVLGVAMSDIEASAKNNLFLTDAQSGEVLAASSAVGDYMDLRDDVREISIGNLAKLKAVEFAGMNISGAVQNIPMTIGSFIPYVGAAVTLGSFQRSTYNEIRRSNPTMSRDAANTIATISAPIQAITEIASDRFLFGRLPNLKRAFTQPIFSATGALSMFTTRAAIGTATEVGEEFAQGITPMAVQSIASALNSDIPGSDWDGFLGEFAQNMPELISTILPLAIVGAGTGQLSDFRAGRQMARSTDMLIAAQYSPESAAKISELANAGKWSEAEDAMRGDWAKINAKGDNVAQVKATAEQRMQAAERLRGLQKEQVSAEGLQTTSPEYTASVTRTPTGWQVTTGEGTIIPVESAEAARRIAVDLRQVGSQEEADTLVSVIDGYYEQGKQAETVLTGETVQASNIEAVGVVATRRDAGGAILSQRQLGPQALETVRAEAEVAGIKTGTQGVFAHINGSNEVFPMRVADGAKEIVRQMNLYKSQSEGQPQVITFLHESFESTWRLGMTNGTFSDQETRRAMGALLPAFEGVTALNAEEAQFIANLRTLANGQGNETMLRETVSEMVIRDVLGRDRQGRATGMKPGSISRAIEASVMGANTQEEASALKSILAAIKAFTAYLKGVFGTVDAITKARDEGKLGEEYDTFINKVLGIDEVKQMESQAIDEGRAMLGIDEETQAVIDAGNMAFSTSRAQPADTSNVTEMPDGAQLVGPTTFSIEVYHGTPHEIDRFRMANIGTGEGAQAFGWGLYFAKSFKVADDYRGKLQKEFRIGFNGKTLTELYPNNDEAARLQLRLESVAGNTQYGSQGDSVRKAFLGATYGDMMSKDPPTPSVLFARQVEKDYGNFIKTETGGNLYTVELLPDEDEFLDWDKPLSEQNEKVRDAASELMATLATTTREKLLALEERQRREAVRLGFNRSPINMDAAIEMQLEEANGSGAGFYKLVKGLQGKATPEEIAKAASEHLASIGIPGIRYLDGGSRAAGDGTSNYVIFDENLVKILEKNGQKVDSVPTFSISPAQDAEYLAAAKAGDTETAQRLVDQLAMSAGYNSPKLYHGTGAEFSIFDKKRGGSSTDAKSAKIAFFFTDDEATAKAYAVYAAEEGPVKDALKKAELAEKRGDWDGYDAAIQEAESLDNYESALKRRESAKVVSTYLKGDFLEFDAKGKTPQELSDGDTDKGITNQLLKAQRAGKTGVLFKNLDDAVNLNNRPSNHYAVFKPDQIKSADPITYDDAGNIIPLSQRFNEATPDIRFSISRVSEEERITPENKVAPSINGKPAADIFAEVKKRHGITRSIYEAGYVLPDGTMLDFTGRADVGDFKQGPDLVFRVVSGRDWMKDQRGVDHREIEWQDMPDYQENWERMVGFLRLGAVRVDARSGMISMHSRAKITAAQASVLKSIVVAADGAYIDLEDDARNRSSMQLNGGKWGKVNGLLTRWANGETPEFAGQSFSISPVRNLNELSDQVEKQFAENPVGALKVKSRVIRQFAKLADKWSNERWTPQGNKIRPISEKRTVKSLDKEQAMRQAQREVELTHEGMDKLTTETLLAYSEGVGTLQDDPLIARMLNDNGKLMSKATAEREGRGIKDQYDDAGWLPPQFYARAGGIMPDVMANNLGFDYASEMWAALESSIKSHRTAKAGYAKAEDAVKAVERAAFEQARKEAQAWRNETDAMQKEDWSPRESLVRDLITLEAIIAMFPQEIRGKIGGFVALARKASESARLKVLQKQLERGQVLLEKHLKDQYGEATDKLLKRFKSQKDASGRITGKIISTATEQVDYAAEFIKLGIEEQSDRQAALEKKAEESEDANEVQDALTKLGIARLFDMYSDKDSASRESAFNWLNDTIEAGKLGKKIIDEARKEMLTEMRQSAQSSILAGDELNPDVADNITNLNKGVFKRALLNLRGMLSEALWTTIQRLELIFGEDSKILNYFAEKIINAANLSTDIKRLVEAQKKDALSIIFNSDSKFAHARGIAELQKVKQSGISTRRVKKEEVKLDIETLTKLNDGTMSAETAGLEQYEVDAALEEFAANARKSTVTIEKVVNAGTPVERTMSETQGIQWWLWSMQDASRKQMERDGWDADSFKQLEEFLSPEAKALGRWISGSYQDAAGMIDPIYRKLFNAPLPRIKNYSPIHRRNMSTGGDIMDIDGSDMNSGLAAGFVKARVNTTASLVEMDALAVFLAHWENVSHWVSHAELMRDMKAILLDKDTAVAIRQKKSEGYLQRLKDDVKTIEKNGTNSASELVNISRVWRWFMQYRSYKGLAFRLSPIIKQTPALLNPLIADVPAHNYMMGMARAFIEPQSFAKEVSAMWSSDIIRRRIEAGFSAESRVAMQGAGMTGSQAIVAMQAGMMPMSMVDGGWTALGAAISFDYYRRGYMRDNSQMTPEIADAKAIARVEKMIATSAQPSDVYARSLSERSGNPFMKSMSMFVSDQRKALAIELMAIRRLATGKSKNKTLDIQRAFVAHFVQAGVSQVMAVVIASLLGDDEDRDRELSREQWTLALALGPINGLFVFGRLADKIGRGLLGLRVFPADDLASKVANDLLKGGKNMDELFNPDDADDFMDALDSSSTALGAGMSAAIGPAGGAVDVGANVLREARKIQKRLSE